MVNVAEREIQQSVRAVLERRERARAGFVENVAQFLGAMGGPAEAALVANYYIQEGVAKFDGTAYRVKNGMFFDSDVLVKAVAIAKKAEAGKAVA